jgi:hypothetical protein
MSKRASRSASVSFGSGPNTLLLPSSIHTSPSSAASQLPCATRAASTRLNNAERAADSNNERCALPTRRPANIASAASTLPPSWPKRCSPKPLGTPRARIASSRDSMSAGSPRTSRRVSTKRLPASAPRGSLRSVPARFEHAQPLDLQRGKIRRLLLRQVHAEALAGERMAILQAGITDAHLRNAGPARQLLGDRCWPALLDRQQQVFALSVGAKAGSSSTKKSSGRVRRSAAARPRRSPRQYAGFKLAHARTSSTTACAAMPSPRPVKPSFRWWWP